MSECARLLWSNAYLFSESGPAIERQKNLRQVEQLLHEGVLQSIRGMLPVKSILKEYLADDTEEAANEAAADAAPVEDDTAPVIHEESIQSAPPAEEQTKPVEPEVQTEIAPLSAPTPLAEPVDVSGAAPLSPVLPPPPPTTPTIIVDTEPPTVGFTSMDAVLDVENPERTTIQVSNQIDMDDADEGEITHIEVDANSAPEPVDDFEELELAQETIAVGEDEFETL
jgi:hypothetical protein